MALRKIEGRGELHAATSAVMEMCVDNPREDFSDIFATHPSIDSRIAAIVKFAGGRDPGPLALEADEEQPQLEDQSAHSEGPWGDQAPQPAPPAGPWEPQQPSQGAPLQGPWGPEPSPPAAPPGPWGPRRS
jgi:heat shock protein HtpX